MYVTYVARVTHATNNNVCMYGLCEIGYSTVSFHGPSPQMLGLQLCGATVETVLGIAVSAVRMMMPAAPGSIADTHSKAKCTNVPYWHIRNCMRPPKVKFIKSCCQGSQAVPRTRDKLHSSVSHLLEGLPVASGSFKYPVMEWSICPTSHCRPKALQNNENWIFCTKSGGFITSNRLSVVSCLALSIHLGPGLVKLYHPSEDASSEPQAFKTSWWFTNGGPLCFRAPILLLNV